MVCLIETKRLQLCHFCLDDAPFVLKLVNEPGWIRFIGDRGIRTVAQAEAYLRDGPMASYAANGFGLYLVRRTADNVRLGMCGLVKRPSLPNVDIGFAFLDQHTGQGYALEAAMAVLNHAHTDLKPVVAITAPDNVRSIKLLRKLGLQFKEFVSVGEGQPQVKLFYPTNHSEVAD
ncbi:GNAT family N-acetyltransferase [Candidatus Leptofilum sp.]|uniref:GNAT family N-acetyltransferase n=1 Tax=Candidatus Leptofilum sp. TaxID=3241576 RepID=UPI003B599FD1